MVFKGKKVVFGQIKCYLGKIQGYVMKKKSSKIQWYFFCKYSNILGNYSSIWVNDSGIGKTTVVFGANTVVFWVNTAVFRAKTVLFGTNTVLFWPKQWYLRQIQGNLEQIE